jgi:hypothetical protein
MRLYINYQRKSDPTTKEKIETMKARNAMLRKSTAMYLCMHN